MDTLALKKMKNRFSKRHLQIIQSCQIFALKYHFR